MVSKTLKVTISGSYRTAGRDIESFDGLTGIIPRLDEDKAHQMCIMRYARIWVSQAKKTDAAGNVEPKYKFMQKVRQVFIDNIEDNDEKPNAQLSYVGKNIMEMNFEELQDLAAANDLNAVPLYKTGSLAHARRVAWSEYAIKVLELEDYASTDKDNKWNLYDYRTNGFSPALHEPIIADGEVRRHDGHVQPIEESIDREAMGIKPKSKPHKSGDSKLSLVQLRKLADSKNIPYHKSTSYDALYKKLYGAAA